MIDVSELVLPDRSPPATWFVEEIVRYRWSEGSPLRRAAFAVLAHWEGRGVDLAKVHLHGADLDVDAASTPYFAGFGLRYFGRARRCFVEDSGEEWIEVVKPTRRGPMHAIMVSRGLRFADAGWAWSDCSYFS